MNTIEIIDPHIHYWNPYTTPRSVSAAVKLLGRFPKLLDKAIRVVMPSATIQYFGETELFTQPHLPDIYFSRTGQFNVQGVVHVQADWQAKQPTDFAHETIWLDALDPSPLAIIGEARLHDQENIDAVLDAHIAASPRFRGIRDMLAYHPAKSIHKFNERGDMMQTAEFRQGFAELGQRELSFDAFIYSHQLGDLCDLVETHPQTRVVVDHMATPIGMMGPYGGLGNTPAERAQIRADWQAGLQRLAQSSQVHMKLSGLFMHVLGWAHHEWPSALTVEQVVEMIGPDVQFVLDMFGPQRCMFASNFPPDRGLIDFETLYGAYFEIVRNTDKVIQKALFFENAKEFYQIVL